MKAQPTPFRRRARALPWRFVPVLLCLAASTSLPAAAQELTVDWMHFSDSTGSVYVFNAYKTAQRNALQDSNVIALKIDFNVLREELNPVFFSMIAPMAAPADSFLQRIGLTTNPGLGKLRDKMPDECTSCDPVFAQKSWYKFIQIVTNPARQDFDEVLPKDRIQFQPVDSTLKRLYLENGFSDPDSRLQRRS